MSFLGNRSFQVKVVKDQKNPNDPAAAEAALIGNVEAAAAYADIVKNLVTHTALVVAGAFVVCKVVERLCR